MYIYEGHLGSLYVSDYYLEHEDLYCETCGDSDRLLGYAETRKIVKTNHRYQWFWWLEL